jgi:hypothetical protein
MAVDKNNVISPDFDFLIRKNLLGKSRMRILSHTITGHRTDVVDVLEGDGIYVQLSRERGTIFVRIGPGTEPHQLLNLKLLRLLVLGQEPQEMRGSEIFARLKLAKLLVMKRDVAEQLEQIEQFELSEDARFLRTKYSEIRGLLSDQMFATTKRLYDELRRERLR